MRSAIPENFETRVISNSRLCFGVENPIGYDTNRAFEFIGKIFLMNIFSGRVRNEDSVCVCKSGVCELISGPADSRKRVYLAEWRGNIIQRHATLFEISNCTLRVAVSRNAGNTTLLSRSALGIIRY